MVGVVWIIVNRHSMARANDESTKQNVRIKRNFWDNDQSTRNRRNGKTEEFVFTFFQLFTFTDVLGGQSFKIIKKTGQGLMQYQEPLLEKNLNGYSSQ